MGQAQHIWGREQRRDASSEWPSTTVSTLSGELMDNTKPRRRRHRSAYLRLALPALALLALSVAGVLAIARHLHV